ncbi:MAG TPA: hypothetical protein VNI02_07110, partial [Blastocatellia bacterium]|nr:hypothetical protein [Blastocatellia bacterium]
MQSLTTTPHMTFDEALAAAPAAGGPPGVTREAARALIRAREGRELDSLMASAAELRDRLKGRRVTYSKKVFIPLTNLCRDYCGYCTFRKDPGRAGA